MITYEGCTEEEWNKAVEEYGLKEWGDGIDIIRRVDFFGKAEQIWVDK